MRPVSHRLSEPQLMRCEELYDALEKMQHFFRLISRVAPASANVLVIWKSSTGNKHVVQTVRPLCGKHCTPVGCLNDNAVSPRLIKPSSLRFQQGGFTDTTLRSSGCCERTGGNILFLNEIAEMPAELQMRPLQVLKAGRFKRIGSQRGTWVKVRVIPATALDSQTPIAQESLRRDVSCQQAKHPANVPPLRKHAVEIKSPVQSSPDRLDMNGHTEKMLPSRCDLRLRKLMSLVQRTCMLTGHVPDTGALIMSAAKGGLRCGGQGGALLVGGKLAGAGHEPALSALDHCKGKTNEIAGIPDVSLKILYNKLHEYQARMTDTASVA